MWSFAPKQAAPKEGANSTCRANQRLFSFRENSTWMTKGEKQNLLAAYSTSP